MANEETLLSSQYQEKELSYFQLERQEMLQYIPEEARTVLDVGCGSGNFGQLLKAKHPTEMWGVELNEQTALIAAQKLDRVLCGAFNKSLDLPRQNFDCIVFNDVIEHLVDPSAALLYAKELLRPGGVVVASIPNVRYFDNMWKLLVHQDWHYTDSGILDRTHLRFFTRRSILETFVTLDYRIECIAGINPVEEKHPYQSRRFYLLNWLLFNKIEDMRYLQFAVVACPDIA